MNAAEKSAVIGRRGKRKSAGCCPFHRTQCCRLHLGLDVHCGSDAAAKLKDGIYLLLFIYPCYILADQRSRKWILEREESKDQVTFSRGVTMY